MQTDIYEGAMLPGGIRQLLMAPKGTPYTSTLKSDIQAGLKLRHEIKMIKQIRPSPGQAVIGVEGDATFGSITRESFCIAQTRIKSGSSGDGQK